MMYPIKRATRATLAFQFLALLVASALPTLIPLMALAQEAISPESTIRWLNNNAQERTRPTTERPTPEVLPSMDGYQLFLDANTIEEINRRHLKSKVPFWSEMMAHPNRDEFWKKRDILPHLKNVAPAVMVVAGWYDAEDLYGSFKTYQTIERQNPDANNVLVVGPWIHGGWASGDGDKLGSIPFGSNQERAPSHDSSAEHLVSSRGSQSAEIR